MAEAVRILVTASSFPAPSLNTGSFILDQCLGIQNGGRFSCLAVVPHSPGARAREDVGGLEVRRYRYAWPENLESISGDGIVAKLKQRPLRLLLVPAFVLGQLFEVLRGLVVWKPRVLIANWIVPQGLIAVALKPLFPRLRVVVVCLGGDLALLLRYRALRWILFWVLRRADLSVACSSFLQKKMCAATGLPASRFPVIPMGASIQLRANSEERRAGILFIGRLEEKKGLSYLVDAFALLSSELPALTLTVVGDGTLRGEIEARISHLGLGGRVILRGSLPHADLGALYSRAEALVVPSINAEDDFEGLPVALLEAIAHGTPVVTTDAGGITDVIVDGVTGSVAPQRDSESLAGAIRAVLADPTRSTRMASAARDRLHEGFTHERVAEKYQRALEDLLAKP